jgi:hypothetical protein
MQSRLDVYRDSRKESAPLNEESPATRKRHVEAEYYGQKASSKGEASVNLEIFFSLSRILE